MIGSSSMIPLIQRATLLLMLSICCKTALSATPAGTVIRNQASASYLDAGGNRVSVTSNLVETRVEQVAGLALVANQQQHAVANGNVRFTHRIRNTGNGDDRYSLQLNNVGGDDINLSGLSIYADTDRNGIRDNDTPINNTKWMAADADYYIVVEGQIPASVSAGDIALLNVMASSYFDTNLNQSNTNTVLVDDGATLSLVKSISRTQGLSPSGLHTVRLQIENTGVSTATSIAIIDALPAGMSYVPGSGRWSGSSVDLSDANPLDVHTGTVASVRYCAYDASCVGLPEAQRDADSDSSNQVTLIMDSLVAGDVSELSFQVSIDADLPSGELFNQAEQEFNSNGSTSTRGFSNTVGFSVLPSAGVVANGSITSNIDGSNEPVNVLSGAQGGVVLFENIIWNTGNKSDTFNIELQRATATLPAGSHVQLLRADAATPLLDSNGDGIIDTGPLPPGTFARVVLRVDLSPDISGNNAGNGFSITKLARSVNDATVLNSVTDHLDEIVANQVDITNQAPAGSADALGTGPGPEPQPVSTLTAQAGGVTLVDLYVRHQGSVPDTYALQALSSASGDALPDGWSVHFHDPVSDAILSDTGPLASGASRHIVAKVSLPATLATSTTSLFFKAYSRLTGASDIKHDAIVVGNDTRLNLAPSLAAQAESGGTVLYRHTLSNIGNTSINNISLQLSHSLPGWTGTVFTDANSNGELDDTDPMASGPFNLAPDAFSDIFVKVFVPANAGTLDRNISTLVATGNAGGDTVLITDTTTVTSTHVSIRKDQAVDMGCDGTPDTGSSFTQARLAVPPGNNCVLYRLTALNTGLETSYNVKISDNTPSFTRYRTAATCSRVPCWVIEPANEGTGPVSAETDQLLPGDSFSLIFAVRIE